MLLYATRIKTMHTQDDAAATDRNSMHSVAGVYVCRRWSEFLLLLLFDRRPFGHCWNKMVGKMTRYCQEKLHDVWQIREGNIYHVGVKTQYVPWRQIVGSLWAMLDWCDSGSIVPGLEWVTKGESLSTTGNTTCGVTYCVTWTLYNSSWCVTRCLF